jgi:hypothetical protein
MFFECVVCGVDVQEDEVLWSTKDGILTTEIGDAYCVGCVPEEKRQEEEGA